MIKCKKHGLTFFGKICKKCQLEKEENLRQRDQSYLYSSIKPKNDDSLTDSLLVGAFIASSNHDYTPEFKPSVPEERPIFEGGESGGGGASRGFEVESDQSSNSYESSSSNDSDSSSSSSDSSSSSSSSD
jgi:hypothetical protein